MQDHEELNNECSHSSFCSSEDFEDLEDEDPVQVALGKRNRREGGLVSLTNTFIDLLKEQKGQ